MQQKAISNKKVLLVADSSQLHDGVILHGINLSKRMDASLEILHLLTKEPSPGATGNIKKQIADLNPGTPVGYIQIVNHRGLTAETVEYAKNRRNIFCVVLCMKGMGAPRKKGRRQEQFKKVTKLLNCPVVLFQDKADNTT